MAWHSGRYSQRSAAADPCRKNARSSCPEQSFYRRIAGTSCLSENRSYACSALRPHSGKIEPKRRCCSCTKNINSCCGLVSANPICRRSPLFTRANAKTGSRRYRCCFTVNDEIRPSGIARDGVGIFRRHPICSRRIQ